MGLFALVITLVSSAAAASTAAPQLLVYRFDTPAGMNEAERDLYADRFEMALANDERVHVLSRRELVTLVDARNDLANAANCIEGDCLRDLSHLGAIRYFVAAALLDGAAGRAMSVKLFDRERGSVLLRRVEDLGSSDAERQQTFTTLADALLARIEIELRPPTPSPPWGPIVTLAAALGATGVGIGFAVDARAHYDRRDAIGGQLEIAPGQRSQAIANVAFVSAGVGAAVGLLWWWLAAPESDLTTTVDAAALDVRF